jgi:hypothetical protein
VVVSPAVLALAPNASVRLDAWLARGDSVLVRDPRAFTFRSLDSCVAYVTPEGRVFGGRHGETGVVVSTLDGLRAASVRTTVRSPAVLRVTIQAVTTGSPPVPADLAGVRGTITVHANVDESLLPGRVELALGGRVVETRTVAAPAAGGLQPLAFTVNTAARDPVSGEQLFFNGFQNLTATVASRRAPIVAGCPEELDRETVTLGVTLANPTAAAARAP